MDSRTDYDKMKETFYGYNSITPLTQESFPQELMEQTTFDGEVEIFAIRVPLEDTSNTCILSHENAKESTMELFSLFFVAYKVCKLAGIGIARVFVQQDEDLVPGNKALRMSLLTGHTIYFVMEKKFMEQHFPNVIELWLAVNAGEFEGKPFFAEMDLIALDQKLSAFNPVEGLSSEPLEDEKKKRKKKPNKFSRSTTIQEVMSHLINYHKVGSKKSTTARIPSDDGNGGRMRRTREEIERRDYYAQDNAEFERDARRGTDQNVDTRATDEEDDTGNGNILEQMFGKGYDDDDAEMELEDNYAIATAVTNRRRRDKDLYVSDNGFVVGDNGEQLPEAGDRIREDEEDDYDNEEEEERGTGKTDDGVLNDSDPKIRATELENLVRAGRGMTPEIDISNTRNNRTNPPRRLPRNRVTLPPGSRSLMSDIFRVPTTTKELATLVRFFMTLEFMLESIIFSKPKERAKNTIVNMSKLLRLPDNIVEQIRCSLVYPASCFEHGEVIDNPFVASTINILRQHVIEEHDVDLIRKQLLLRLESMDHGCFVETSADKKRTTINFQWNIVYEVMSLDVQRLRLHTFDIPPDMVDEFVKSRYFWDIATEWVDTSKSNVEILMEAVRVLSPRGLSFLSDDKGGHEMIKFPVLGHLMVILGSFSRTLLQKESTTGMWDTSLVQGLFQDQRYSKFVLNICIENITNTDDDRRNPTWTNLAKDYRFVRTHSKFATHLNSAPLKDGRRWICHWNPFENRFGINGTMVEWLQTTCAHLGINKKTEFWQMFLVCLAGLSPTTREYLMMISPPGTGKTHTGQIAFKLFSCLHASGKKKHGLMQLWDAFTANSLRASPVGHALENCKTTKFMNEWVCIVPSKQAASASASAEGDQHPVVANMKKMIDDGILWVSRGTINKSDPTKIQENRTMIIRDHSLVTFSNSVPSTIIPKSLLNRFLTQNVRINKRENENTPSMTKQEVEDNITTYNMIERMKIITAISSFCMQLQYIGANFTNNEVERRQMVLSLSLVRTMAGRIRADMLKNFNEARFQSSIMNLAKMWAITRATIEVMGSVDTHSSTYRPKRESESWDEWNQCMADNISNTDDDLSDKCKRVLERTCVLPIDVVTVTTSFFDGNSVQDFLDSLVQFVDWKSKLIQHNEVRYIPLKEADFKHALKQELCEKRGVVEGEIEGIQQTLYTQGILLDKEITGSLKKLSKCMIRFNVVSERMVRCKRESFVRFSWRIQKKLSVGKTRGPFVSIDRSEMGTMIEYFKKCTPYQWMVDKSFVEDGTTLGKVEVHADCAFARYTFIKKATLTSATRGTLGVCDEEGLECYVDVPLFQTLNRDVLAELSKVKVRWIYGDENDIEGSDDLGDVFTESDDEFMEDDDYGENDGEDEDDEYYDGVSDDDRGFDQDDEVQQPPNDGDGTSICTREARTRYIRNICIGSLFRVTSR